MEDGTDRSVGHLVHPPRSDRSFRRRSVSQAILYSVNVLLTIN